ncbi:hypothetical protein Tco_0453533 [Tanacetum coccineum]
MSAQPEPLMSKNQVLKELGQLHTFSHNLEEPIQNVQNSLIPPTSITSLQMPPPFHFTTTSTTSIPPFRPTLPPSNTFIPLDQSIWIEEPSTLPLPQEHSCPYCQRTETLIHNLQDEMRRIEYGVSTSIGYDVSSSMYNTAYSSQLINTAYPPLLETAYRSSEIETEILCMTRSSMNELFTPYKDPEREFRSSRRHFKTLSLDELRSPNFNLLSDQEYSKEEEAKAMAKTMEQYISKTRIDYGSGVARPKINNKDQFKLKGQFLKELR